MSNTSKSAVRDWLWLIILAIIIATICVWINLMPSLWLSIWLVIEPWLWFIISIAGIIIIYKFMIFVVNRYIKKYEKFPKDAANGIVLIIRIIIVFAILLVLFPALNLPSSYLVNISTILATAIGLASTIAVSNVVAGFYMIASRPYKLGDYISVDGTTEGIVKEIGLNYTKIKNADAVVFQIPNNKIFSSNLINFSIEPALKKKVKGAEHAKFTDLLTDMLIEKNIVRYIFDVELAVDLDPKAVLAILDQVCDRWEKTFGYRPKYYFHNFSWRITVRWALFGDTPEIIMNNSSDFLEDIWLSINKNKEEAK
ncbi:MAG TPA: mechanosensitive ion channel domain-containing protein [Candidatus Deferrimicrobium sp.]|nr:mechanosensitive ion channel domain-containing protein [Candidatus Deferrimicrobium sp.]